MHYDEKKKAEEGRRGTKEGEGGGRIRREEGKKGRIMCAIYKTRTHTS